MTRSCAPFTALSATTELDELARRRAARKGSVLIHALVYVLVNSLLVAVALWRGRPVHPGPLLGWGLGLGIHALVVWPNLSERFMHGLVERERRALAREAGGH